LTVFNDLKKLTQLIVLQLNPFRLKSLRKTHTLSQCWRA